MYTIKVKDQQYFVMSLQLQRNDQNTVINIAQQFVNFYYTQLNNKTYTILNQHLKDYTIYSSQKVRYRGNEILKYYNNLHSINATFSNMDFDTLHAGARRINVLVTGTIKYIENTIQVTIYKNQLTISDIIPTRSQKCVIFKISLNY